MLDFDTVYRIMVYTPEGSRYEGLAINPRPIRKDDGEGTVRDGFEWIPNSPFWPRKHAFLRVTGTDPNKVEAVSVLDELEGYDTKYVFEPLTLANLQEVSQDITGYDELVKMVSSDSELQEFFATDWGRDDWTKDDVALPPEKVEEDGIEDLLVRAQLLQQAAQLSAQAARKAAEEVSEAKAAEVGEVRFWKSKNKWMEKARDGTWVQVEGPGDTATAPSGTVRNVQSQDFQKQQDDDWSPVEPGPRGELSGEWKDEAEGLPSSSREANWDAEKDDYSLERKALHSQIRHDILKNIRPVDKTKNKPRAVITMGIPASGKSEAVSDMVNTANYAHVDPDRIREQLPEFQAAVDQRARNGGSIVAEETNDVADEVLSEAIGQGMNVVLEGVGGSPDWYEKELIPTLKKMGYEVSLMLVHEENVDAAISRAEHRGRKTGRFVPERRIREAHPKIPQNFEKLAKLADSFAAYESGRPPKKMWSKSGNTEVVSDQDAYDRFKKFTATEWYETLLGAELKEGEDKPAEMPWDDFLDVMEKAWEADQRELDAMPDQYEDGVQIPVSDFSKSLKVNKE